MWHLVLSTPMHHILAPTLRRGDGDPGPRVLGKAHGSSLVAPPSVGRGWREDPGDPPLPQIIYLRRFKDLRTLSLSGNPVAEAEDYRTFICAYLPDLVYLDFRHIDDHMVAWPSCVQLRGSACRPRRLGRGASTGGVQGGPPRGAFTAPVTVVPPPTSRPPSAFLGEQVGGPSEGGRLAGSAAQGRVRTRLHAMTAHGSALWAEGTGPRERPPTAGVLSGELGPVVWQQGREEAPLPSALPSLV